MSRRQEYTIALTWDEAMNLVLAAERADTDAWTPAARAAMKRASEKVIAAVPVTPQLLADIGLGRGANAASAPGRRIRSYAPRAAKGTEE